ncbi:DUF6629 family protein [Bradyrhizobium sp. G127]|uniref:DUF6629 family protein n=1 Tax=Bradyrhizobium sp. G127 TaxID=2904800 RepID=UPI001F2A4220|nr:DUF6629 family protein [Bradyrhizobium sp. G127]MCF2521722.1 hypothetical protein [Bradyrhizobium sp. G127]
MCFSAEASFTAAAVLVSAGAVSVVRAYKTDRRYLPIAALPLLFGLQQGFEGAVWMANGNAALVAQFSLAYMFFSWLAWPVWVPFSVYFLESERRKPLYLVLAIVGGMLGAMQYFPYFAHNGWLTTQFLPRVIVYEGKELFDYIIGRHTTYAIYVAVVVGSLLLSREANIRIFGLLVATVLIVTYLFFSYAYISVFCFGGALMSLYLVWIIFGGGWRPRTPRAHATGQIA